MYYFNHRILIQEDNKRIILVLEESRDALFFCYNEGNII